MRLEAPEHRLLGAFFGFAIGRGTRERRVVDDEGGRRATTDDRDQAFFRLALPLAFPSASLSLARRSRHGAPRRAAHRERTKGGRFARLSRRRRDQLRESDAESTSRPGWRLSPPRQRKGRGGKTQRRVRPRAPSPRSDRRERRFALRSRSRSDGDGDGPRSSTLRPRSRSRRRRRRRLTLSPSLPDKTDSSTESSPLPTSRTTTSGPA